MTDTGTTNSNGFFFNEVLHSWTRQRKDRLSRAYHAVANHDYWSRLWIVQELRAAQKIDIMCGGVKYNWSWLRDFSLNRHFGSTPMQRAIPLVVNPSTISGRR